MLCMGSLIYSYLNNYMLFIGVVFEREVFLPVFQGWLLSFVPETSTCLILLLFCEKMRNGIRIPPPSWLGEKNKCKKVEPLPSKLRSIEVKLLHPSLDVETNIWSTVCKCQVRENLLYWYRTNFVLHFHKVNLLNISML